MTTNSILNLGTVQEKVEDTVKSARQIGRKSIMAYVGLFGMVYDVTVKDGSSWLAKAEKRGERIETDMTQRVTAFQKQAMREVESLGKALTERVRSVSGDVNSTVAKLQSGVKKLVRTNKAVDTVQEIEIAAIQVVDNLSEEVQKSVKETTTVAKKAVRQSGKKVEQVVEAMMEQVETLDLASEESKTLPVKKSVKKTTTAAKKAVRQSSKKAEQIVEVMIEQAETLDLPIEKYNTMLWNQVVTKVQSLDKETLLKVREYEVANRNRPSILKAIDAKLAEEKLDNE